MKKISRSKIDLFIECRRCFYLDVKLGIKRPPGFPFSLNNAVDTLLKKEFDAYRILGEAHPIQLKYNIDAVPANHPELNKWRNSLSQGVSYHDLQHDCKIYGGIDDLWISSNGTYHVVDYKATAKSSPVTELPDWAVGYRRQMEIYQWLLRKNNLPVSDIGYFVYCTGDTTADGFQDNLKFNTHLIAYNGNDNWVDDTLEALFELLEQENLPVHTQDCPYCQFAVNSNK